MGRVDTGTLHEREPPACLDLGEAHQLAAGLEWATALAQRERPSKGWRQHDSPWVGHNLQDHYIARISYSVHGVATVNERSRGMGLAGEVLPYLVTGKVC